LSYPILTIRNNNTTEKRIFLKPGKKKINPRLQNGSAHGGISAERGADALGRLIKN
jgi:hypothetical protein